MWQWQQQLNADSLKQKMARNFKHNNAFWMIYAKNMYLFI